MIANSRDADREQLWQTEQSRRIPASLRMRALKKLFLLHASVTLDNLRVPPGNRLEVLRGQRKSQHSIRINDQYRVCFVWREGKAYDVEIVDYHLERTQWAKQRRLGRAVMAQFGCTKSRFDAALKELQITLNIVRSNEPDVDRDTWLSFQEIYYEIYKEYRTESSGI